tara:strand:+ start:1604 stop:1996 length:393 start_codon:yes stop_codon:yes gene_type:complete
MENQNIENTQDIEMTIKTVETLVEHLIGEYGLVICILITILIFKKGIEKLVSSLFMFWGSDYDEDDIVWLDGRPARIARIGFFKTTFFIYEVNDGKIIGGSKLVVQNERLSMLKIEKPLPLIDLNSKQIK